MKKYFALLLAALLLVLSPCAAYADSDRYVFGFDGGGEDTAELDLMAQELFDEYGVAVCYIYADTLGGMTLAELARTAYDAQVCEETGLMLVDCREADEYYVYFTPEADPLFTDDDIVALCNAYDAGGASYLDSIVAYFNAAEELLARVMPGGTTEDTVKTPSGAFIPAERQLARVVDNAGVLSADELAALNSRADEVSAQYLCDVAVVFVAGTDGKDIKNYAFDFFDYNGYGYGDNDDGVMLVVDVEGRYFQCISHAFGAYAFTDAGQEYADDYYLPYLSNNDWNGAADAFITVAAELLAAARNGAPVDIDNMPKEPMSPMWIIIDLAAGFVLALIPVGIMKRKLKTVEKQTDAASYVRLNSFRLRCSDDRFIRRHVTRTPRPKPNDNHGGGGGGGGTSFSSGSSGRSFGSHGGRF